jgi:hypothetical protein
MLDTGDCSDGGPGTEETFSRSAVSVLLRRSTRDSSPGLSESKAAEGRLGWLEVQRTKPGSPGLLSLSRELELPALGRRSAAMSTNMPPVSRSPKRG